jgi:hypothetical protein
MSAQSNTAEESQKKKLIVYCVFGVVLVVFLIYSYNAFFGGPSAPPPSTAPAIATQPAAKARTSGAPVAEGTGQGVAPGIAATKVASTSSSLDPTLDERAMLRTESLVYSGSGRNIFSLVYTPPVAELPKNLPSARPVAAPTGPPVPTGPPPPPPINLKYFGTVVGSGGKRQAFLLHDDDVYLASEGDIVARRYKIVSITATSAKVEDLSNQNQQSLPLQTN